MICILLVSPKFVLFLPMPLPPSTHSSPSLEPGSAWQPVLSAVTRQAPALEPRRVPLLLKALARCGKS